MFLWIVFKLLNIMDGQFESEEFFYSNDLEELKKERKKRQALHALLPYSMGGKDNVNYVLVEEKKSNDTKSDSDFENDKKKYNFDPWELERTLDWMRVIRYPKLNGEYGTQILDRAPYHEEEIPYISNAKFESVIGDSLYSEGGYSNNKNDRGGETNFGITRSFMEDYKYALPGGEAIPIKDLTIDDAKKLFKALWERYNLWQIRDKKLAYAINDYMINSYAGSVARRIQKILNSQGASLKVDGCFGPKSLEAIHKADTKWLIDEIIKERYSHYRELVKKDPGQIEFYTGWIKRLNRVSEKCGSELRFPIKY